MIGTYSLILFCISILLLVVWGRSLYARRKKLPGQPFPESWKTILESRVFFYRQLSEENRQRFQEKVQSFLSETRIQGVDMQVDDATRLLVAASAVIPVFHFDHWSYVNLSEVLVYQGMVETYQIDEAEQDHVILGQVRPFQTKNILLLSSKTLEQGFELPADKGNVGIHEFAHLIDGADGDTDGIPKLLMPPELIEPWSHLMYKEVEKIKKEHSDINPYGITNRAEFFAVVCEYFFENPEKLKKKHPALHQFLGQAFHARPGT